MNQDKDSKNMNNKNINIIVSLLSLSIAALSLVSSLIVNVTSMKIEQEKYRRDSIINVSRSSYLELYGIMKSTYFKVANKEYAKIEDSIIASEKCYRELRFILPDDYSKDYYENKDRLEKINEYLMRYLKKKPDISPDLREKIIGDYIATEKEYDKEYRIFTRFINSEIFDSIFSNLKINK